MVGISIRLSYFSRISEIWEVVFEFKRRVARILSRRVDLEMTLTRSEI